ncbi:RHS repeat-associated core domain-containing protein [Pseudomonas sp. 3A(2025)]
MSVHQTLLCRYHYDPLDRLAGHVTAGAADIRLFYQKSRLAMQAQGALHRSILQVDDQLLAQQHSSGKAVDTTLLATDQQRSVLQSIGGGQREASAYTAYGHLPMSSGLSSLLSFDGERRDPVTGHYLLGNGYRAFNPVLMRFNSPDSLSPFGDGGLNAYTYCQGDPVNYRDPTGYVKFRGMIARFSLDAPASSIPIPRVATPVSSGVATPNTIVRQRPVARVTPMPRSSVAVPISNAPSGSTASNAVTAPQAPPPAARTSRGAGGSVPRPINRIDTGGGSSFDFYDARSLAALSDDQLARHIEQNFRAFISFDVVHVFSANRAFEKVRSMSDYLERSIQNRQLSGWTTFQRQQVLGRFRQYSDSIRQAGNSLARR